jgi:hypothetical protein
MKRSNKLSLKTETLRQLTPEDLSNVAGGIVSGDCRMGGGGGQSGSITSESAQQVGAKKIYAVYGP